MPADIETRVAQHQALVAEREATNLTGKRPSIDDKFEQLIAALVAKRDGLDRESIKELLAETAKSTQKALRPENETHPHISAFSHPEGDLARPRPQLVCDTFYIGQPIHKTWDTHTPRELELLNAVQPGVYTVLRKDGSPMPVTVKGEKDASGALTKKEIIFSVTREERHYVPPMTVVLYQAAHPEIPAKRAFLDAMHEHLEASI